MDDLISRAVLFNSLANVKTLEDVFMLIQNAPSAEKRGKWLCGYCSCCGERTVWDETDYCPNCGARMEEGD